VEQALTIINHGSPETKGAVLKNEISINRAYQRTQKERKQAEAEFSVQISGKQASEEGREVEQGEASRVAPVLLSLDLFGALHELGGSVEDHVTRAIEQYLESLVGAHETNPTESSPGNVTEDEDEDEEYFDPDSYEDD
jgi:hypothetical protein